MFRVHVPNDLVFGIWGIVIIVQVLGKYKLFSTPTIRAMHSACPCSNIPCSGIWRRLHLALVRECAQVPNQGYPSVERQPKL